MTDSRRPDTDDERARLEAGLAGRYVLRREIGRGGMATVYLAEDPRHGRAVALKALWPELASAVGPGRFQREIEIAARLNHPHILPLHDSGEGAGTLYYVMPYVEGASLRRRIEREGQLPVEEAVTIASQVAAALEYAHANGVIHRDVKPENILLHEGEAVVADFGIALALQAAGERLTQTGLAIGTSEYVSPEQALGDGAVDARSDEYSLACVLYELLAGEPPYTGRTAQAIIAKRLADPVPSVRRIRAAVPVSVDRALMKALSPVPGDRFPSVRAFAEALASRTPSAPTIPSVAILPFVNLSSDPENEYFADGITEDVIAQVSKVRMLKVISRTSVMAFKGSEQSLKEIGARLGAGTLLEGSVRRARDRVRIVAQLIDVETDRHLWTETYDRELTDIFEIQADVALHIASALKAELTDDESQRIRREPTRDLQAYQLYLQGRSCFARFTREGMLKSLEYFERALARDPDYAQAHVGIALSCAELTETGMAGPEEISPRARAAAARALELDGDLASAHSVAGFIACMWDFDWKRTEREFRRALELNPSDADTYDYYARMLSALGRHDEAAEAHRRAQELDPTTHKTEVPADLLRGGRYDEALEEALKALDFDPTSARAHATLGWAYLKKDTPDRGIAELRRAVELAPGHGMWLAQLGQALAELGRIAEAREVLARLEALSRQGYVAPYHLAYVYTGLGEAEAALDCLERAYRERAGAVYGIKGSFLFAPLRSHPRFQALLAKMNLA
jgi:serine/threonine protein kinase/Tfp pilus assembly protein PilF